MKKIAQIIIVAMCAFFAAEVNADAQLLKNLLNKATETVTDATSNGHHPSAADNERHSDKIVEYLKTIPSVQAKLK